MKPLEERKAKPCPTDDEVAEAVNGLEKYMGYRTGLFGDIEKGSNADRWIKTLIRKATQPPCKDTITMKRSEVDSIYKLINDLYGDYDGFITGKEELLSILEKALGGNK